MEIDVRHRYIAEAIDQDGTKLGDYVLTDIDFEPAVQCAHLEAVRASRDVGIRPPTSARIDPVASRKRGAPYIDGFEVRLDSHKTPIRFELRFLHTAVIRGSAALVHDGILQPRETFHYRVCAFDRPPASQATPADFLIEPEDEEMTISSSRLPTTGNVLGTDWDDGDLPVFMHQQVLDEATDLAVAAGDTETGGLLLGQMCRDHVTGEFFLDVSALLNTPLATGTETSLRFGPETFAELDRMLALRSLGECLVGWWHSHPNFCASCPTERRRSCHFSRPFFSAADRDVHRALFPQAHSQALLITDLGSAQPSIDLFSWRHGTIAPRGCLVTHGTHDVAEPNHGRPPPTHANSSRHQGDTNR